MPREALVEQALVELAEQADLRPALAKSVEQLVLDLLESAKPGALEQADMVVLVKPAEQLALEPPLPWALECLPLESPLQGTVLEQADMAALVKPAEQLLLELPLPWALECLLLESPLAAVQVEFPLLWLLSAAAAAAVGWAAWLKVLPVGLAYSATVLLECLLRWRCVGQ